MGERQVTGTNSSDFHTYYLFFHLYSNIAPALFILTLLTIWISLNIQLCWFPIIVNSFIPHDSWWYLSWMFSQQLLLKVESGHSGKLGGKESLLYFESGNLVGVRWTVVQRLTTPNLTSLGNQWSRDFIAERRGLHAETAQSDLIFFLKLVM